MQTEIKQIPEGSRIVKTIIGFRSNEVLVDEPNLTIKQTTEGSFIIDTT